MTFIFKPAKCSADLSGTREEEPPLGIPRFSFSWGRGQAAAWTQPCHREPLTVSQACPAGRGVPPSSVPVSPTPGPKERTGGLQSGSACPARGSQELAHTRHSSCCGAAKPPLCHHGNASCEGQGGWRSSPELVWAERTSSGGESPPITHQRPSSVMMLAPRPA